MTSFYSIGDLSRSFQLRLGQNSLKQRLTTLSNELSSGVKSDISKALGGNLSVISYVSSRMTMLNTLQRNAAEMGTYLDGMQTTLDTMQKTVDELGPALLTEATTSSDLELRSRISAGEESFRSIWNALNTSVAGRHLFSGSRTDTAPLQDFDTMMASLNTAVAGAATANDIVARIGDWFDAPPGGGGFVDMAYSGDDTGSIKVSVSPDRQVGNDLTANSAQLRNMLKGMAAIAYASQQGTALDAPVLRSVFTAAGTLLANASTDLISARTEIGEKQSAIEKAKTGNAEELSTLTIARNDLIGADPYETAVALEETEAKIETMYTLTARLSRLRLTDYL